MIHCLQLFPNEKTVTEAPLNTSSNLTDRNKSYTLQYQWPVNGWVCADQCMPELPASSLDPVMKSAFPEVHEFLMEHANK